LPIGAGYVAHVSPYNFIDLRGNYTIHGYKRAEAEFVAPRLFKRRGELSILVRADRSLRRQPRPCDVGYAGARLLQARTERLETGRPGAAAQRHSGESQGLKLGEGAVSRDNVERVMSRLLSDEELRIRFMLDRLATLTDLNDGGLVLTPDEVDLFVRADAQIWFGYQTLAGPRFH
jgi:hypothetical protein